jgi:O-antigen/teichoic acid export membrane protein
MLKDSLYMLLSVILKLATTIIIFMVLAREWGVSEFGLFTYIFTLTSLLALLVDYGFALKLVKDISKTPQKIKYIVSEALCSKIILSLMVIILSCIWMVLFPADRLFLKLYWLLLFAAIFFSFSQFFLLPFRALNKFKEETKVSLQSNLLYLIIVFILIWNNAGQILVAIGFLVSRVISLFLSYKVYKKNLGNITLNLKFIKPSFNLLKSNFPYAIHLAIGTLYVHVDTIIIHYFLGNEAVGKYQAALRIIIGAQIFAEVLTNVYLPKLSKLSDHNDKLIALGKNMTRQLLIIGALVAVVLIGISEKIIVLFYGYEYLGAAELLTLFSFILLVKYINASYGAILTISNKQSVRALFALFSLLANIILSFCLIPIFYINGSIYSAIITNVILMFLYITYVGKILNNNLLKYPNIFLLFLPLIFFFIRNIWYLSNSLNIFILIVTVILVFVIGFESNDFNSLQKKLKNKDGVAKLE